MRFRDALAGPGLSAIAEIKRRSPSAGDLRPDADPTRLAREFEEAGAAAISVLVDERFGGSPGDLSAARAGTTLPILAKGFFRGPDEIAELQLLGADAVLLLLRDLDDRAAARLMALARKLNLDTLVEAHTADELERAIDLGADPIGINARDLETFQIDRRAQLDLVAGASPTTATASSSPRAGSPREARRPLRSSPALMPSSSARPSCGPPTLARS